MPRQSIKRFTPKQEADLEASERHYARSAALMAGAAHLLDRRIEQSPRGDDAIIKVVIGMLVEAASERDKGRLKRVGM